MKISGITLERQVRCKTAGFEMRIPCSLGIWGIDKGTPILGLGVQLRVWVEQVLIMRERLDMTWAL